MSEAIRKFIIALAAHVPLAGGLYLKWNQVQERPLVAATVGLLYELVVVAAAFWKKVWAELEKDAIKATADGVRAVVKATEDWVFAAVRNLKPGFRRRYNKEIIHEYGALNVRGLGLINTFTLKLDQVFVDLRIAPSVNPRQPEMDPIAVKELTGNRPIWEFLRMKRGKGGPAAALAVIGPPGCGKTTLLQHVALTLAANRQRRYRLRAYTPALLFLRDHAATITKKPGITLGALAEWQARKQFKKLKPPPGWFERQLQRGKCLVLLDGLDEVAEREKREAISRWVDRQIRDYKQCSFIVSSRPQGYLAAPLQRAHVIEVQPFNAEQMRQFIKNFYVANEIAGTRDEDIGPAKRRAHKDAGDLIGRLRKAPALADLTVNPLLLTMIAIVHRCGRGLPESRAQLYDEICAVFLGRWQTSKGLKDNLTAAQKRSVLQPLAAEMMKHRLREISADWAMAIVRPLLASVGLGNEHAKTALNDFQAGTGLLLERETGQWSFAHLTLQEFLTAAHWLDDKNAAPNWDEIVGDSWWHETLRLYSAQGDATRIAKACLANGSVPALTLAFDCLEEARTLDAGTRAEINTRLIMGLESDDPELRRIAAEVRLARRLNSLQRIDDKREIDLTYLTCAEYQLFLDDMRAQRKYCQPDHWTDFTFARGQAHEPVCGVRYEDAVEFCKWLTERQGGESLFRLPLASEARKWQPDTIRIAAWCGDHQSPVGVASIEQELRRKLRAFTPTRLPLLRMIARARALDHALDRALARAIDRDLDLTRVRDRALALAVDFDLAIVRDVDRTRIRALARALTRDFSRVLAPALARAFVRALARTHTRARALEPALDSNFDLTRDLARARALASSLVRARTRAGSLNLPSFDVQKFERAIERGAFVEAQRSVEDLMNDSNSAVAQWGRLLGALVAATAAENLIKIKSAQRRYAAYIIEYAYEGYEMLEKVKRPWWQRLLRMPGEVNWEEVKQIALEVYWWLQIVRLRVEGKLEAWEGIRIVSEQVDLQPGNEVQEPTGS